MKKAMAVFGILMVLSLPAHAQFGNLINNIKNNPILASQGGIQGIISKAQGLAAAFAQMPLNSGKLEFIKAALPLLTQAQGASTNLLATVQQNKTIEKGTESNIGGLLDQVKGLMAQKWSSNPLTPAQIPDATKQTQQLGGMISNILKSQGDVLKNILQAAATK